MFGRAKQKRGYDEAMQTCAAVIAQVSELSEKISKMPQLVPAYWQIALKRPKPPQTNNLGEYQ